MKIYTKTGDEGQTGLVGGQRIPKNSLRINAIGDVDELNAFVGHAVVLNQETELQPILLRIQSWLFGAGAELASTDQDRFQTITEKDIEFLEISMDKQNEVLSPLKNFILPGGSELASRLHIARSVARRTERTVLALHESEAVRPELRIFLNRLADWFFVAARTANHCCNVQDVDWKRGSDSC